MTENDHFGSILDTKIPSCLIIKVGFYSIMKRQTTLAMFGILFAAGMALGMVSVSGFSQPLFVASTDMKAENQMGMMGHITFTATNKDGNILSYIQTDNVIVNVGENCTAESLFNVTTMTNPCAGIGTQTVPNDDNNGVGDGGFTYIAIGTGGGTEGEGNSTLNVELNRIKDNMTSVVSSTGTGADSKAVVTISEVFTATVDADVDESGLFDSKVGGNDNMLARQVFGVIPLTTGDKLTVEWEITIGADSPNPS